MDHNVFAQKNFPYLISKITQLNNAKIFVRKSNVKIIPIEIRWRLKVGCHIGELCWLDVKPVLGSMPHWLL